MTFLPIVERELRVRARWPVTYHARWIAAGVALLIAWPMLMETNPIRGISYGQRMFVWLSVLTFLYCLFEGARQTADCLSSERRSGTLGLLFLTDLKGYDIVLGKIAGTALSSFYGLLAVLPVIAVSIFAGGVTGGEFWRMVLVLITTLFFSLSAGMWVSSRSREEQKSMGGAAAVLIGMTGGLPCLELLWKGPNFGGNGFLSLASPGYPFFLAFDTNYRTGGQAFGQALLVIMLLSLVFLGLAARGARQTLEEQNLPEGFWQRLGRSFVSHGSAAERATLITEATLKAAKRRYELGVSPVFWLAGRQSHQLRLLWGIVLFMAGVIAMPIFFTFGQGSASQTWHNYFMIGFLTVGQLAFWFCACSITTRFFADTRRSGALELLMCTPLDDDSLLKGQWLHLKRALLGPVLCLWVLNVVLAMNGFTGRTGASPADQIFLGIILQGVGFFVQVIAVCRVGIWMGITSKKPAHAVLKTFGYVVLLPWLVCSGGWRMMPMNLTGSLVPMLSFSIGSVFIQWIWNDWAKQNLEVDGIRALLMKEISGVPRQHRRPDLRESSLSWH